MGSPFRAKQYELKFSEVYPVPVKFANLEQYSSLKVDPFATDTDSSTDDDGSVYDENEDINHHIEDMVPEDIVLDPLPAGAPTNTSEGSTYHTSDEDDLDTPALEPASASNRPQRQSKPPPYLQDYVTD